MIPVGSSLRTSSSAVVHGRIAENTPCSLTRRAINCVYCPPKSSTTIPPCSAFSVGPGFRVCRARASVSPDSCAICPFPTFIPAEPSILASTSVHHPEPVTPALKLEGSLVDLCNLSGSSIPVHPDREPSGFFTFFFTPPRCSAAYLAPAQLSQSSCPSDTPPLPDLSPPTSSPRLALPLPPPSAWPSPFHSPAPQFRLPLPSPTPRCRSAILRSTVRPCARASPTALRPSAASSAPASRSESPAPLPEFPVAHRLRPHTQRSSIPSLAQSPN